MFKHTTTLTALTLSLSALAAMADDQRVHFTICGGPDWAGDVTAKYIAEWEGMNPGYFVDPEYIPWGQCQEKATTLAAAGNAPALSYLGSRTLAQLSQADLIKSFELTDEEKASYAGPVLGTVTYDGKIWGVPRAFSSRAMYYNRGLFEEAGLDPNSPPETWEEFLAAAKAISENTDSYGFGIPGNSTDTTMQIFLGMNYSNGGAVLDDEGNVVLDSPETLATMKMWIEAAKYAQPGIAAYGESELTTLFAEGKLGMYLAGPWIRSKLKDVDYATAFFPHGPSGTHSTFLVTDSYAVFKGTGLEEQAESLAKLLTAPKAQLEFDLGTGLVPLRNIAGVEKLIEEDVTWAPFINVIPTGGPEPVIPDHAGLKDIMVDAIQGALLGEISPEDAISEAAELIKELN
jgi:multiple sugar transport system substrate-binding protein